VFVEVLVEDVFDRVFDVISEEVKGGNFTTGLVGRNLGR